MGNVHKCGDESGEVFIECSVWLLHALFQYSLKQVRGGWSHCGWVSCLVIHVSSVLFMYRYYLLVMTESQWFFLLGFPIFIHCEHACVVMVTLLLKLCAWLIQLLTDKWMLCQCLWILCIVKEKRYLIFKCFCVYVCLDHSKHCASVTPTC